ncbi:hypothetical protein F5141DRAFT_1094176 [Pisolithus sp. B1]|nr:hypothetical protein F5141DRAFT_1094176 [Pisolithus sp. B1]
MKLGVKTPAALIIFSVTLDCAAAQWISTRFANTTDETSGELDLRCHLVETAQRPQWRTCPTAHCATVRAQMITPCNLEIAGFVELVSVAAQFISTTIDKHAKL